MRTHCEELLLHDLPRAKARVLALLATPPQSLNLPRCWHMPHALHNNPPSPHTLTSLAMLRLLFSTLHKPSAQPMSVTPFSAASEALRHPLVVHLLLSVPASGNITVI